MRKFLVGLVALAVIARGCSNDDDAGASGPTARRSTAPSAGRTRPTCAPESAEPPHAPERSRSAPTTPRTSRGSPAREVRALEGAPEQRHRQPASGEGYESAVAYAIAEQLGFTTGPGHVGAGERSTSRTSPGPRTSTSTSTRSPCTPERAKAVDFSDGLLRRQPGARRRQGHADRDGAPRSPTSSSTSWARRSARPATVIVDDIKPTSSRPCIDNSVGRRSRRSTTARSTATWSTPRRAYVNVLIGRGQERRRGRAVPARSASRSTSGSSSPRATRSSAA